MKNNLHLFIIFALVLILFTAHRPQAQEVDESDTYAISLVQTAETDKEIFEVENQKVLAEEYEVVEGDHIWNLLRQRGLLEDRDLPRLLFMLKRLNSSLSNLDLIHPGQRIMIPLKISPHETLARPRERKPPLKISPEEMKEIDFQNYMIHPGDSLTKVITGRYNIPAEKLYGEYLDMVRRLNPAIEDLDRIYPGQVVRLPVYTQEVVRASIEPPPPSMPLSEHDKQDMMALGLQLNQLFSRIGEEWVQSGEHFIPLKSGGQISLKAETYPLINLSNGIKVIVDLYGDLPEKMVDLIQSNWEFYRVVKLRPGSSVRNALNLILPLCNYERLYPAGRPLELGGDIRLHLKADWIIRRTSLARENERELFMIHLLSEQEISIPGSLINYLRGLGIESVFFPFAEGADKPSGFGEIKARPVQIDDRAMLIDELLKAIGKPAQKNVEIPVYQKEKKDFSLIIKADFLFKDQGRDYIIDLRGLDQNTLSMLTEHGYKALPLGPVKKPDQLAARVLKFLNTTFDQNPHNFKALDGQNNHIQLTIPGLTFRGSRDQDILITHLNLSPEIVDFLATKGYKVWLVQKDE